MGQGADDVCVQAMFQVALLFVEGRVPRFLRRWYAGGSLVGYDCIPRRTGVLHGELVYSTAAGQDYGKRKRETLLGRELSGDCNPVSRSLE